MNSVLLTGSGGLIGKEAILPLQEMGFNVFAPTKSEMNILDLNSVRKFMEKQKPEYLLHFAWFTGENYLNDEINISLKDYSLELLKIFAENGGKRAVFAGTCFETWGAETLYAKCKNELREQAMDFCSHNEIFFGWGRIYYVFGHGERETRLLPYIANSLKNEQKAVIKGGSLLRDYMYSKDIATAFVKFLASKAEDIVDICSGEAVSIASITSMIANKLKKEHLLEFAENTAGQPSVIVGDKTRLTLEVGFVPKYSLEQAINCILEDDWRIIIR
ncbi:MAG: NAD(P)-dependent oxidoreductase [Fibromonadaceae bacterium]|jgi:nucleoside-diphosphate-sugar epimerase|nr:NAD(P)-dependent oxidoreductase [Fibromonadaceae bacterium]